MSGTKAQTALTSEQQAQLTELCEYLTELVNIFSTWARSGNRSKSQGFPQPPASFIDFINKHISPRPEGTETTSNEVTGQFIDIN